MNEVGVKRSRVQRPCKVDTNFDETQTRKRKYNETSFLFLIFLYSVVLALHSRVPLRRKNASKSVQIRRICRQRRLGSYFTARPTGSREMRLNNRALARAIQHRPNRDHRTPGCHPPLHPDRIRKGFRISVCVWAEPSSPLCGRPFLLQPSP